MKYYFLQYNSSNTKITGTQFQSIEGIFGDIQNDLPFEGLIDFKFKLPEPFLEKKAIPTTYLNSQMIPSWFLILDNQFISFLNDFKIGDFQTWDIKVHHNKALISNYDLFILNFPIQREVIDFKNSRFYIGKFDDYQFVGDELPISDYDDYLEQREKLVQKSLCLKHKNILLDFSKVDYDLFRMINVPCSGYFVSEKLKEAIEKKDFTGMTFKKIEEIDKTTVVYQ